MWSLFWPPCPPLFSLLLWSHTHDSADNIASTLQCSQRKPLRWEGEQSQVTADQCADERRGSGWWSGAVNSVLLWCSLTESLTHLGWVLAENRRSDKAQLCLFDPAHWVLNLYRCGHGAYPGCDGCLTGRRAQIWLLTTWRIFYVCFPSLLSPELTNTNN